ncbi:MAG: mechanosensitive ion channel family protein [Nannocystaceae bacterium]
MLAPPDLESLPEYTKTWFLTRAPEITAHLVRFLITLLIGWIIIRVIVGLVRRVVGRTQYSELLRGFFINLTGKLLWVILLMIALPDIGIDVGPLIAGLGVGGFIIGFAFKETLGNFAAGLMLLANEPFKKGHYVEAGGAAGTVADLNIMSTTLISPDNKVVTIPNGKVWGDKIVNFSARDTRRVDFVLGVGYGSDLGRTIEIITALVKNHPAVLAEPAPVIAVNELADSSVNLIARPWVKASDYWKVHWELTRAFKEAFDQAGIEIPFPQVDMHVRALPPGPKAA